MTGDPSDPWTHLLTLSTYMAAMLMHASHCGADTGRPALTWAGWHFGWRPTGASAGAEAERAAEVSGAWLALAQVAALDPSAPSWEFLQVP